MDSKVNTSTSTGNCIKVGTYSLKPYKLEKWMKQNGYTHSEMASALKISTAEFYRKLCDREKFDETQIYLLLKKLGPQEAMRVLYFPSAAEREKLYQRLMQ